MTVLFVNMSIDRGSGGGTAARTMSVYNSVKKHFNVDCSVLTTDQGLSDSSIKQYNDAGVVILPCLNDRFYIPYFSFNRVKEIIEKVDIIHLMSHWTIINIIVYLYARVYRKPYTFCPAGTLHIFGRSAIVKKIYNYVIGNRIVQDAMTCIAITDLEKEDFYSYGVKDEKILVIPNGISVDEFYPDDSASYNFRKRFGLDHKEYMLFMGRLNEIKGPDILLDSFLMLAEKYGCLHLVFAGPDEGLMKVLREKVVRYNLDNFVHFVGYIDGDDKVGAYTGAKMLIVPSRREAMSIVALEAGACGTPVLLTTECGFDEVKEVGCAVVPPTVDGLYDGINTMLSSGDLGSVGVRLKEKVINKYTWTRVAEKYMNIHT